MENTGHAKLAVTLIPEGNRKRGRPKETWMRAIEREEHISIFSHGPKQQKSQQKEANGGDGPILLSQILSHKPDQIILDMTGNSSG